MAKGGPMAKRSRSDVVVAHMDKPFDVVIWGWLLVDDEVANPKPGEVLSGLQLHIGPLGPRYGELMEPLTVQATVEWVRFDEENHRINTVIGVDGNRLLHTAPAHSEDPLPAIGSSFELTGFVWSLPFYDSEDVEIPDAFGLTQEWRVLSMRPVPDDDSLIVEIEPV